MENWIILLIISLDVDAPMMCMEIMRQKYVYLYLSASWPIERISLYNIYTIWSRQVIRIKKHINKGTIAQLILYQNLQTVILRIVWQTIRRILWNLKNDLWLKLLKIRAFGCLRYGLQRVKWLLKSRPLEWMG